MNRILKYLKGVKVYSILLIAFILLTSAGKKKEEDPFSLKTFEKTLVKIDNNLFASRFETTNLQYRIFLKGLLEEERNEDYEIAQIDSFNWHNYQEKYKPFVSIYHRNSIFNNHPVVNISYDGAVLFCQWLTDKYNLYPKRRFKKVIFRLPTEDEWTKAAKGNNKSAVYPWGTQYLRNTVGEVMCNYRVIGDEQVHRDFITGDYLIIRKSYDPYGEKELEDITVPVRSYGPNSLGLYNLSGNVAEMLIEKGRTKGGSWHSTGFDVRIDAPDEHEGFDNSSLMIGFRYFMEVIDSSKP